MLRFRIYDAAGNEVVNTDESRLKGQERRLEHLRKELEPLWSRPRLTPSERDAVTLAVRTIVDYTGREHAIRKGFVPVLGNLWLVLFAALTLTGLAVSAVSLLAASWVFTNKDDLPEKYTLGTIDCSKVAIFLNCCHLGGAGGPVIRRTGALRYLALLLILITITYMNIIYRLVRTIRWVALMSNPGQAVFWVSGIAILTGMVLFFALFVCGLVEIYRWLGLDRWWGGGRDRPGEGAREGQRPRAALLERFLAWRIPRASVVLVTLSVALTFGAFYEVAVRAWNPNWRDLVFTLERLAQRLERSLVGLPDDVPDGGRLGTGPQSFKRCIFACTVHASLSQAEADVHPTGGSDEGHGYRAPAGAERLRG